MGLLKAVIHGEYSFGTETRNVFYLEGTDAVAANGQQIVDDIIDVLGQAPGLFNDEYSFVGGTIYDLATPEVPGQYYTRTGGALVGTNTTEAMPGQVAFLLNLWSYSNRPNRKRTYLAGMSEGRCTDGLWSSTTLGEGDDIIEDLLAFDTFSGLDQNMCSYGLLSDGVTYDANYLDDGRSEAVPATQRRRRRGQGI